MHTIVLQIQSISPNENIRKRGGLPIQVKPLIISQRLYSFIISRLMPTYYNKIVAVFLIHDIDGRLDK